jgi:excisionase family DNA binding protein
MRNSTDDNKDEGFFLGPQQLANQLNISVRTVWRWVSAGTLCKPDVRIGRVIRWRRSTIERWLQKRHCI